MYDANIRSFSRLLLAGALIGAVGCGGSNEPASSSTTVPTNPEPMPVAETVDGPDQLVLEPYPDRPELTVRVDGPGPVPLDETVTSPTGRFATRLLVQNGGDEAAVVDQAHVSFEVWGEDGSRNACTRIPEPGATPLLEPGEAHVLRAETVCSFPSPGEYEVRTYVSFDAEALDGSHDIERYYAGRREIAVE